MVIGGSVGETMIGMDAAVETVEIMPSIAYIWPFNVAISFCSFVFVSISIEKKLLLFLSCIKREFIGTENSTTDTIAIWRVKRKRPVSIRPLLIFLFIVLVNLQFTAYHHADQIDIIVIIVRIVFVVSLQRVAVSQLISLA